jgi:hypothetical protein
MPETGIQNKNISCISIEEGRRMQEIALEIYRISIKILSNEEDKSLNFDPDIKEEKQLLVDIFGSKWIERNQFLKEQNVNLVIKKTKNDLNGNNPEKFIKQLTTYNFHNIFYGELRVMKQISHLPGSSIPVEKETGPDELNNLLEEIKESKEYEKISTESSA